MRRYRVPDESEIEPEQPFRSLNDQPPIISDHSSHMTNRFKILLAILILVIVLLGGWMGSLLWGSKGASGYTAVFLTSGDAYFGKFSWFPWPKLSHAWFLQRSVNQQNQPQLGLAPFSSAFWGPAGDIYLNPKQILFWAPIKRESEVARAIENSASIEQMTPSVPGGQSPQVSPQELPAPEGKK